MHITFFNRCYWPDSEATGQLLTELAEWLAEEHRVEVVVGQPNYVAGQESFVSCGQQERNGVLIQRLQHLTLPKRQRFGRIRNLISFTWSVRQHLRKQRRNASRLRHAGQQASNGQETRLNRGPDVLAGVASTGGPSVWVCETDPFLLPLVVGPAARRRGQRLVYYLQDIYPDVAIALGVAGDTTMTRLLRQRLKKEYLAADAIVVLDQDMAERLEGWGIPGQRLKIVPNWMDCQLVRPVKSNNAFRKAQGLDSHFVVMHSGNMGMTQRLDVLAGTMSLPEIPDDIRMVLVGDGAERGNLEQSFGRQPNIRFVDYQPRGQLSESLSAADLHVISMDQAITGCLAPSKLYGILASATPILAIVPEGNAVWRLVQQHQLGWCVKPSDTQGIARAIVSAQTTTSDQLQAMGQRGRQLAIESYDRQVCCRAFQRVLEESCLGSPKIGISVEMS